MNQDLFVMLSTSTVVTTKERDSQTNSQFSITT